MSLNYLHLLFLLDSKSWTPKILNDIVGRKKIQSECSENNPLELLPERRSKIPQKSTQTPQNSSSESGEREQSPLPAVNYLLTEVFCSTNQPSAPVEVMLGDSVLAKSLNYLFVEQMNRS